jgi:DHA1 family bicyclomycin/chloramphenicol resistance-like MFS transporter
LRTSATASPSFPEFVALIALMMGVTAFSIDNLLPAFDVIRARFRVENPNDVQILVYGYMVAFALAQMAYGPVSDIVGRRPVLLVGLAIFTAGSVLAMVAPSFEVLIAARVIQGIGTAAARVLAVAIVRDRFEGREMARVMSLAMMVFLTVPIFAPAIGSALLLVGSWPTVFASMLVLGLVLGLWFGMRMPETLHPEFRFPFSFARIADALRLTVSTRISTGYATAVGLMLACVMAYVGSAQQILETTVYGLGSVFSIYFGLVAAVMGLGSLLNSQLVRRIGMRRLSHSAICIFVALAGAHLFLAMTAGGRPSLTLFMVLLSLQFFLFSLTVPNFNAMAMQPLGAVAGTASSFIGSYTTLIGAIGGFLVGRAFDGSVIPLTAGLLLLGLACLAAVLWAEQGHLFVRRPPTA